VESTHEERLQAIELTLQEQSRSLQDIASSLRDIRESQVQAKQKAFERSHQKANDQFIQISRLDSEDKRVSKSFSSRRRKQQPVQFYSAENEPLSPRPMKQNLQIDTQLSGSRRNSAGRKDSTAAGTRRHLQMESSEDYYGKPDEEVKLEDYSKSSGEEDDEEAEDDMVSLPSPIPKLKTKKDESDSGGSGEDKA